MIDKTGWDDHEIFDDDDRLDYEMLVSPYGLTKTSLYNRLIEYASEDDKAAQQLVAVIVEQVRKICRADELLDLMNDIVVKRIGEITQAVLDERDIGVRFADRFPV